MCWTRRSATARSPRRSSRAGHPGRYLVFGDPKDLKGLMDKELDEVEVVPEEEPKPKKYRDEYIIPGSGFRMLVGDIHHLIVLDDSLARRLSEAETGEGLPPAEEKGRRGDEKVLKKLFRSLGLPEDSNAAQDILEESIIRRHNLVRLEDAEEPQDEGDLEGDEVWSDLTHVSLFSGIGGLDLAAEAAGLREPVCQCEWADYPYSVLRAALAGRAEVPGHHHIHEGGVF